MAKNLPLSVITDGGCLKEGRQSVQHVRAFRSGLVSSGHDLSPAM